MFISVGYSILHQKLNIYGKATIAPKNNEIYEKGNSTYSWQILDTHKPKDDEYTKYDVMISIINMDSDISSYEISFDIPESYNDSLSSIDGNVEKKYENGRLTIYSLNGSGYISNGEKLELKMHLAVKGDLSIDNLALNGKLAINGR